MCGIVGIIGKQEASSALLEGLKRLEYRGYDSAGIAVLNDKKLSLYRAEGKLSKLVEKISKKKITGTIGIGHTRWATHGKPSEKNAHPHKVGRVVLIHNGIIENYLELKKSLPKKGKEVISETDTEVIAHLIDQKLKSGLSFLQSFRKTIKEIEGAYSIVAMDTQDLSRLYLAKKASPMVIGIGKSLHYVASDIPALLPFADRVVFLENDEIAVCEREKVTYYNKSHKKIQKESRKIKWTAEMAEKGGYKHFMMKEIMEQPKAVQDTLRGRLKKTAPYIDLGKDVESLLSKKKSSEFERFYIVACGTSWHAALAGKYYIEAMAKIPVTVDTASEFRYREPYIDKKTLLIVISQSGETADTLACAQEARRKKAKVLSICNVVDSSIPRSSHATLYTQAGPEIGVASTKAFTTQMVSLLLIALYLGREKKTIDNTYLKHAYRSFQNLPHLMDKELQKKRSFYRLAEKYHTRADFYYMARGIHYPIALEGALKLKEISYIHAEGYSAGEMKHGPIALIEPGTPVLAIAPKDRVCEKMISNIEEVRARGASMIVIATEGDTRFKGKCDHLIIIPKSLWYINPILVSIPLQLLAYYVAVIKGTDVDQPRNLAKSVTVE